MTEYQKTNLVLPDEAVKILQDNTDLVQRNLYIVDLHRAGWTYQSIADPMGLSRERVRQIKEDNEGRVGRIKVPTPPEKIKRQPAEYREPRPEVLERLLTLQPDAQRARGPRSDTWPAAEEYTRLLFDEHKVNGVPVYRLAKRLGVTHGAIRSRFKRYPELAE